MTMPGIVGIAHVLTYLSIRTALGGGGANDAYNVVFGFGTNSFVLGDVGGAYANPFEWTGELIAPAGMPLAVSVNPALAALNYAVMNLQGYDQ